jgi:hypothetical protein
LKKPSRYFYKESLTEPKKSEGKWNTNLNKKIKNNSIRIIPLNKFQLLYLLPNTCRKTHEHLFWECNASKTLWLNLTEWLNMPPPPPHTHLTMKEALLGNPDGER